MSKHDSIFAVAAALKTATSYPSIFGKLPDGVVEHQLKALRGQFAYLAMVVHPDHAPESFKKEAAAVFVELNKLRTAAEEAVRTGTYDKPFRENVQTATILQSSAGLYRLDERPFQQGDFSALYLATIIPDSKHRMVVKIATDPLHNPWLENEARILKRFGGGKGTGTTEGIHKFLPTLVDTFTISGDVGKQYRANVMTHVSDLVSVAEIIKAHPTGQDPRDAAWIARRVFAQTLAASMAGVVHGAITPDHVLVHPLTHEPLHIGWAHALDTAANPNARITHIINRWKDWYPPEVFAKKQPDHKTDLYMAGKTVLALFGGDTKRNILPSGSVPQSIARVITACVQEEPARRPHDGKSVLDEFTRAVKVEWGRVHRPLHMPATR